jgi:membrane associated rhomboid family serine protease
MLGYWFILQFIGGFFSLGSTSGGVAFWAHIGGFIAGIMLLKLFCSSAKAQECRLKRGSASRMIQRYKSL